MNSIDNGHVIRNKSISSTLELLRKSREREAHTVRRKGDPEVEYMQLQETLIRCSQTGI